RTAGTAMRPYESSTCESWTLTGMSESILQRHNKTFEYPPSLRIAGSATTALRTTCVVSARGGHEVSSFDLPNAEPDDVENSARQHPDSLRGRPRSAFMRAMTATRTV